MVFPLGDLSRSGALVLLRDEDHVVPVGSELPAAPGVDRWGCVFKTDQWFLLVGPGVIQEEHHDEHKHSFFSERNYKLQLQLQTRTVLGTEL